MKQSCQKAGPYLQGVYKGGAPPKSVQPPNAAPMLRWWLGGEVAAPVCWPAGSPCNSGQWWGAPQQQGAERSLPTLPPAACLLADSLCQPECAGRLQRELSLPTATTVVPTTNPSSGETLSVCLGQQRTVQQWQWVERGCSAAPLAAYTLVGWVFPQKAGCLHKRSHHMYSSEFKQE